MAVVPLGQEVSGYDNLTGMLALYVSSEMVRRGNKVTYTQVSHGSSSSRSGSLGDGNLIGMVRRALYVSQEMVSGVNTVTYSQMSHGSSSSLSGCFGGW